MIDTRAVLPVQELLDEMLGDWSADHDDGDNPGYYVWSYDETSGILTVQYDADDDAAHVSTVAAFRFVGAGQVDDEGDTDDEEGGGA